MNRLEDSIINRMEFALKSLKTVDFYMNAENGRITSSGKKNIAKSIIEYSNLSKICENKIEKEKLENRYKEIVEAYGLK